MYLNFPSTLLNTLILFLKPSFLFAGFDVKCDSHKTSQQMLVYSVYYIPIISLNISKALTALNSHKLHREWSSLENIPVMMELASFAS